MNEDRPNNSFLKGSAAETGDQIKGRRRGLGGVSLQRSGCDPGRRRSRRSQLSEAPEGEKSADPERLDLVDELMRKAVDMIVGAGVPAWAVERMHLFQSPNDYRIVACVSEYARANQGIADVSALEIGIHCDLPEAYVEARTEALSASGCLLCDARDGDRYFLRVPQRPPLQMHSH